MTAIDLGPLRSPPRHNLLVPAAEAACTVSRVQGLGLDTRGSTAVLRDRGALDGRLASAGHGVSAQDVRLSRQAGGESSGGGASVGALPPARVQPGQLQISVNDPVKRAEAGLIPGISGGYVLYRVDSRSLLPSYRRERNSVRRRFRDFVVRPICTGSPFSLTKRPFTLKFQSCDSNLRYSKASFITLLQMCYPR